jgi:type VI protein secretion system component Hcp
MRTGIGRGKAVGTAVAAILAAGLCGALADAAVARAAGVTCRTVPTGGANLLGFAKISGVTGGSNARGHVGEIDLTSLDFCVTQSGQRAVLGDITLGKAVDRATPQLISDTETNRSVPSATIILERQAGEARPFEFFKVELTGVHVTDSTISEQTSGIGEQVKLSAARVRVTFRLQNSDGTPGTAVISCFDFQMARPC